MIPQEILDQLARLAELNDTELADLLVALNALTDQLLDGEATDEANVALSEVAAAMRQVTDQQEANAATAAARETERDRLRDEIRRMTGEADPDDPEADPDAPAAPAVDADPAAPAPAPVPEPVAAAARPAPARTRARPGGPVSRPAAMAATPAAPPFQLIATGTYGDTTPGQVLNPETFAQAILAAAAQTRGYRGPRVKIPVARLGRGMDEYPEDRQLSMSDSLLNTRRVEAVQRAHRAAARQAVTAGAGVPSSIIATGGICAPINVRYDLPVVGQDDRPLRDSALARFGAERGGIKTLIPPTLADLDDAVGFWTEANDQNPGDGEGEPSVKPCLTIDCGDDTDETLVDAITLCLATGNFRARFFPEQVDAWKRLSTTNLARQAETRHIATIAGASVGVTVAAGFGITRMVIDALRRATASQMSLHRDRMLRFRWAAPFWLRDMMQSDIAFQMPVGTWDETLAAASAKLDALLGSLPISVTWLLDGEGGQVFTQQGDAALASWPADQITYLWIDGDWLFLDGGQIDFGIIRDSTLIGTNDFRMMSETFENVHFHGVPDTSWKLTLSGCANGAAAQLSDFDPCAGS